MARLRAAQHAIASGPMLSRLARGALFLLLAEMAAVVVTGDWGLAGQVGTPGFLVRIGAAQLLLLLLARLGTPIRTLGFQRLLALLLLLVIPLHLVAWRLVGDSRWYYSYTHSLAFDGDLHLNNEYQTLGIAGDRGSQPVPETGHGRSVFAVGAPLLWLLFIPAGHVGAWLRNIHGLATPYDGYAVPYQNAVALGNLLLGWLGLVFLDRFLRRWFSPGIAFAATLVTAAGTFLLWYLAYQPLYAHPVTFLLIVLFLDAWVAHPSTIRGWAMLGLWLGAATCTRWQSAVFGLLLVVSVGRELLARRFHPAFLAALAAAGGILVGVLPQLVAWWFIFGHPVIGVPQGSGFLLWKNPFLVEVLFSSRHGLLSWSPVLYLALFGLVAFARRVRQPGLALLPMLALLVYVNATVSDWWAGGAFGARRFDSALPILAVGLAEGIRLAIEAVRRRPALIVGLGLGGLVGFNLLLADQYRSGRLPYDDTVSWERVTDGMSESVFDAVGYPFSFPANWAFSLRYDRPKTQFDVLVGKYLLQHHNNLGGMIDLGPGDDPFRGRGWSSVRRWPGRRRGRLALAPRAGVLVPTHHPLDLTIEIECGLTADMGRRPVEVWLNGRRLGIIVPSEGFHGRIVQAPAGYWRRLNLLELVATSKTPGEPFVAVDRLRFAPLKTDS